jgi:hypothetical protein
MPWEKGHPYPCGLEGRENLWATSRRARNDWLRNRDAQTPGQLSIRRSCAFVQRDFLAKSAPLLHVIEQHQLVGMGLQVHLVPQVLDLLPPHLVADQGQGDDER